ncbi:hypothetical protein ES703_54009 [subsurface metagenome]
MDDLLPGVDATFVKDPLAVGDSESHQFVYKVKADDDDPLVNEVTAIYQDLITGDEVSDVATDTVDLVHPDLEVTKTANPTSGEVGDTITYTIKVENKGDVDLDLDWVSDTLLNDATLTSAFSATLAAGTFESHNFTRDIQSGDPNPLVNTVVFHYDIDGLTNDITDEDDAEVEVIHRCRASIVGAKFQNNCCGDNDWDSGEQGIDGWWIGLFPYEYPYPNIDQYHPDNWDAWGVIQKVQTDGDNVSTPGTKDGGFTFENVCAGIYYVVEERRPNYETCNHDWNLPLRDHYVVIVTEADAAAGVTITYDVYGDNLWFGNKWLRTVFGQVTGVTAQAEGPC